MIRTLRLLFFSSPGGAALGVLVVFCAVAAARFFAQWAGWI